MKKLLGRAAGVALGLALALSLVVMPALADTLPCELRGWAYVNDMPVGAGTNISAWVDGVNVGSGLTGEGSLDDNQYIFFAVGGDAGDTIEFKIGELWALETAIWETFEPVTTNLTAYGPVPTIAFSPPSFIFNAFEGGANPPSQTLQIWNSGAGTLSWTLSDDAAWLSLNPMSGSSTGEHDFVTVSVDISGMIAGSYSANITISAPGALNTPQTVPVTLDIVVAVPTIAFSPPSFIFNAVEGGANPSPQTLQIWNSGTGTLDWTAWDDAAWLDENPKIGSSTGPGDKDVVTVSVNISGKGVGSYSANITIEAPGATNTPQPVPVTLNIAETVPTIAFSPPSFIFNAVEGGANPPSQTLEIWNSGTGTLDWTAWDDAAWLDESPKIGSSTGPGDKDVVTVSVDISGKGHGSYSANITISDAEASNDPQTVPVTLNIGAPTIAFSPATLDFWAIEGGADPASKKLQIWNSGDGTLEWTAWDNAAWLDESPTSGSSTGPGDKDLVTVSVDISGKGVGTYYATITISDPQATNDPQTVDVSLEIVAPGALHADFTATPRTGLAPLRVEFTDETSGGITPYDYEWEFGDGKTSTAKNPSHIYVTPGTYTVTLSVTDDVDDTDSETKNRYIVVVMEEPGAGAPSFSVSNLYISPEQAQPNQQVEISVNIANIGGATGTYSAALYINGQLENSETVSVGAGSTREVMFTVTRADAGTYEVSFAGLQGQFSVVSTPVLGTGLGTAGIVAIIVVAIVLIAAVVYLLRRRT